jgi:diguanylate cyclase (GGDEF)-like protein
MPVIARSSWLFPHGVDRARMLDMDRRLQPVRRASFAVLAAALLASGPWLGWWTLIPLAFAALLFRLADVRIKHVQHPELPLFAAWTASQVVIAVSVALTGGAESATMSLFVLPLVTLGARFSERGIAAGLGITIVLMLGVAFGVDAAAVLDDPPILLIPLALVLAVAMMQSVIMRSDVDTRAEAVLDPLTGMLNRKALAGRVHELREQSAVTGEPIGMIVADLDRFKAINDTYGHAAGDAVLVDVAATLRRSLRAFDLVYRIGGEEFLVLAPGADLERTAQIAEALRVAVGGTPAGAGHAVTMSLGVTATVPGRPWTYEQLFGEADAALLQAKREGRDRVRAAGPLERPAAA